MSPWAERVKPDYDIIHNLVAQHAKVLDLGCGDGALLESLIKNNQARGLGIEINRDGVNRCLAKGLDVLQVDVDQGLADFADKSFDYVILNMTLQVIRNPLLVVREMVRVGKYAIVGFPNFGHYKLRLGFALKGRMPKSKTLPYEWYNTPNIRLMTVKDFKDMCQKHDVKILREVFLSETGRSVPSLLANLLATEAVFMLEAGGG